MIYKVMRRCAFLAFCCLIGVSVLAMTTSFDEAVKSASMALKAGDAKKLAKIFDNSVHLSVKRDEGAFTKFQAELLLHDFFRTNKVDGLKEVQRANNSTAAFAVFSLKTNSKNYRVFIKFVQSNNKEFKVAEVRIE
ncbi:DUF4783 domain-containing protein [Sphingobacterium haloxyli]|uniref:DUF4783 domain-containing protein n=1 Tax=Sphingobacterium haloxyli TaxID=2100533 RepID=A0A2S9J722_9SPHI|nr:DUF4783 domain-containing protein [Sphingobacterium haloxyli]PRD48593.1 DUF4783 domain-containing protein [Sphingobacterium haloxyli]